MKTQRSYAWLRQIKKYICTFWPRETLASHYLKKKHLKLFRCQLLLINMEKNIISKIFYAEIYNILTIGLRIQKLSENFKKCFANTL